ncbi:MAG: ABC transporter ATP-binding protein [Chitinispirillia bacterium]|jgi:lipopolysaccharide transport system ATP-binding protein
MSETVIKVENLSKQYRLGANIGDNTFREMLTNISKAPFLKTHGLVKKIFDKKKIIPKSNTISPNFDMRFQKNSIWALSDTSFEIKEGEIVGVIGRNGAGKSTLLKILSKITEPTRGKVELRGRIGALLEVGTGFHPELTGHENIYLYGAILGMNRWEITKKFDEIVAFAEVEKFISTPVKRYSSGMYMRLAFAVAAHMETEILLVDEVLAVGDIAFQKKCLGKMGNVSSEGRTVIFVSHNMGAIGTLCSRGIVLDGGRIVCDGDSKIAIEHYFDQLKSCSTQRLSERKDRKGSGICRFTNVTFEDDNSNRLDVIRSGQNIRILFDYESDVKRKLRLVKACITINHSIYGQVLYCDNITTGELTDDIPTSGRLICTIATLPLMPGLYSMTVFLKTGLEVIDYIEDAVTFQIEEGDLYGTGKLPPKGIFLLPNYSWSIIS